MPLGQHPGFKWEARRIRRKRNKILILRNHARAYFALLANDVAEDATLFVAVILLRAIKFLDHLFGHDGQGNELAVRVFQRRARSFAVILENEDVTEAFVLLQ